MISKKTVTQSVDAIKEIVKAFEDNTDLSDGIQEEDFKKPFAAIAVNGELIYKTFNPLENSAYLGNEKLLLDWKFEPGNTNFNFKLTQKFKNDDVKLIFSMDGNIVHALHSKPGETGLDTKLELKIKF